MTIQKLRVTCRKCKHVFDAEIVVDCPIAVAAASMKAVRCPECYSNKLGLGGDFNNAPPVTAPLAQRFNWWQERGEHGISSLTIFSAFAGHMRRGACYPFDPDDFRRCKQLLDLMPEWRAKLDTVSKAYPWFKPMIDRWDEIERLYEEESKGEMATKTYALMLTLRAECERLRSAL